MAFCDFYRLIVLMREQIVFSQELFLQMTNHLTSCLPAEGCGLVGGNASLQAKLILPITNRLFSPSQFRMDDQELLAAFMKLEEKGLDLIAIFHSHLNGPPAPSITDLAEFFYPESLMIIYSLDNQSWISKAYRINISDHSFEEIQMIIEENA